MEQKTFSIPNISCGHCVKTIQRELLEIPGVTGVEGDPGLKSVVVHWEAPATLDKIKATLEEIHYPPSE
ncbi:COP-associated protein [uncultured Desulfatiglans sp.]|nr:COP-associated protein [uncultured Desulfatiglans sp.]